MYSDIFLYFFNRSEYGDRLLYLIRLTAEMKFLYGVARYAGTDHQNSTHIRRKLKISNLNEICKITGIIGCSIYREWKAVEYLNRLGNTIHKEVEV
jgi:hypothetical protein